MKASRVSLMMAAIGAALVLGAGAAACCYACGVANPLAAAGGLFQVTCTGAGYAKVQDYPQVMVTKPGTSLPITWRRKATTRWRNSGWALCGSSPTVTTGR